MEEIDKLEKLFKHRAELQTKLIESVRLKVELEKQGIDPLAVKSLLIMPREVLKGTGRIWKGTTKEIKHKVWVKLIEKVKLHDGSIVDIKPIEKGNYNEK